MKTPRALVLTGHGINCEKEMAHCFRLAGAEADIVHVNDLVDGDWNWEPYDLLALPGGFSYGDHLGAGLALANRMKLSKAFMSNLERFLDRGGYVWGICNGFQVLTKLGLLPGTLWENQNGRFEDRWVEVMVEPDSPCVYTRGLSSLRLPVRHGEGQYIPGDEPANVVLRYLDEQGEPTTRYPANPNGSWEAVAGICDPTGRIFGLMPHPEAFWHMTLHPHWTRLADQAKRANEPFPEMGDGLKLFQNVVAAIAKNRSLVPS